MTVRAVTQRKLSFLPKILIGWWWHTPLIPALGRQKQAGLCEFEANLVYKSEFRRRLQSYIETLFRKTKKQGQFKNKIVQRKQLVEHLMYFISIIVVFKLC